MKTSFKISFQPGECVLKHKSSQIEIKYRNASDEVIINALNTELSLLKSSKTIADLLNKQIEGEEFTGQELQTKLNFLSPSYVRKVRKDFEKEEFVLCVILKESYPIPRSLYELYERYKNFIKESGEEDRYFNILFPSGEVKGYNGIMEEFNEVCPDNEFYIFTGALSFNALVAEILYKNKKYTACR